MERRDYDLRADDFTEPTFTGDPASCLCLTDVVGSNTFCSLCIGVVQLHEAWVLHHAGRQGGEIRQQPGRNGAPGQTMEGKGCRCLYQSLK